MYHNEVYAHKDKINQKKSVKDTSLKVTKRKDIRQKYQTRSWKRLNSAERIAATNAVTMAKLVPTFAKVAPLNADFEEHEHELTIDDIRAIASLRRTKKETEFIDMSETAIPTEVIKLVINSLGSDAITPEEKALGYYTRKKLSTWDQWLAGEKKQIDQFTTQGMFGEPTNRCYLPDNAIILRPHWQYLVKRNGVRRSRMCCNGSKVAAPQLHAVASTWSSCVVLPIQRLFLGMCNNLGLIIYGGDATDAYPHSPAPNDTYLAVDEAYSDWYEQKYNKCPDWQQVLPVYHALQGHPESGKMWMNMIDNILIKEMGFRTTTHDRCIYHRVLTDGSVQLMLHQVDDFLLVCDLE